MPNEIISAFLKIGDIVRKKDPGLYNACADVNLIKHVIFITAGGGGGETEQDYINEIRQLPLELKQRIVDVLNNDEEGKNILIIKQIREALNVENASHMQQPPNLQPGKSKNYMINHTDKILEEIFHNNQRDNDDQINIYKRNTQEEPYINDLYFKDKIALSKLFEYKNNPEYQVYFKVTEPDIFEVLCRKINITETKKEEIGGGNNDKSEKNKLIDLLQQSNLMIKTLVHKLARI
jgi:predicted RNA-binding protein with RPS1 domain